MRLNRRKLLTSAAAFGAAVAMPGLARADDESIWDVLARKARKRERQPRRQHGAGAMTLIDTPEPILSFDTAYNLQLAIAVLPGSSSQAGGWDLPTRETFGLEAGQGRAAPSPRSSAG